MLHFSTESNGIFISVKNLVRRAKCLEKNKLFSEILTSFPKANTSYREVSARDSRLNLIYLYIYAEITSLNVIFGPWHAMCPFGWRFQNRQSITVEEILGASKGVTSFLFSGPNGMNNYWWRNFPVAHRHLLRVFNSLLNQPQPIAVGRGVYRAFPQKWRFVRSQKQQNYKIITRIS